MLRRFILADNPMRMFRELEVEGARVTVCAGRVGTDGEAWSRSFETEGQARAEVGAQIAEMLQRGYFEVFSFGSPSDPSGTSERYWERLASARRSDPREL